MGIDDVHAVLQEEDGVCHDQKHQEFMRVALDMVWRVDDIPAAKAAG